MDCSTGCRKSGWERRNGLVELRVSEAQAGGCESGGNTVK